jgi:phospholipase C
MAMSYMTRQDIPYHLALADAFTVGDAYHCSIMGPTNPNRYYLWSGCIGNVNYLGAGGTDGLGGGPVTFNGLRTDTAYFVWETFPEVLQKAGVSWKFYQDLAGTTFSPDFGDGTDNSFAGNFTDNSVLYTKQYATAAPGTPLFDDGCTGTEIIHTIPNAGAPASAWKAWALSLFDQFKSDVASGKLPQVSWIAAPAGYTEHSDWPINYGAWYMSQIFNILVSHPEVFSKTVLIINYDEADGSFDHIVPPTPPQTAAFGASTVSIENEIVTTSNPNGPIGLGTRVPFLAISPWSKGGYVNSQVFDHTSVIQFIEKRFGVHERNISPWRRAVAGDLTSVFNFDNPNEAHIHLPSTKG